MSNKAAILYRADCESEYRELTFSEALRSAVGLPVPIVDSKEYPPIHVLPLRNAEKEVLPGIPVQREFLVESEVKSSIIGRELLKKYEESQVGKTCRIDTRELIKKELTDQSEHVFIPIADRLRLDAMSLPEKEKQRLFEKADEFEIFQRNQEFLEELKK